MTRSYCVILNPTAGRGAGERLRSLIVAELQKHDLDFELCITTEPGHATRLARDAVAQGQEAVLAVGGDGTVNEVLNGLLPSHGGPEGTAALGVLPIGTGNDFAVGAGLPLDLGDACQAIASGRTQIVDVGWVQAEHEEARYFGNGVGLGFDAVANVESRKLKRLRGFLLYLVAVLRTLAFYYKAPMVEIRVDSEAFVQNSIMLSVMNGFRFGGGFIMTPGSKMDDGLFDVCITGQVARLQMVAFVPRFMRGTHVTDPRVSMLQGTKVTVVSEAPWASHVDGEIYAVDSCRFEISLLPQQLRLIR